MINTNIYMYNCNGEYMIELQKFWKKKPYRTKFQHENVQKYINYTSYRVLRGVDVGFVTLGDVLPLVFWVSTPTWEEELEFRSEPELVF